MRSILICLLLLASAFAGCLETESQRIDDGGIETEPLPYGLGSYFPNFAAPDENNTTWNRSMMDEEPWVAYFSAEWCTHCEPTLNASDQTIPAGRMLILNKYPGEGHDDMSAWKNQSEEGLNRSIDRPFIHAPDLATEIGVGGIPFMLFIDADGRTISYHIGLWTNTTEMAAWYESGGIEFADESSGMVMPATEPMDMN
jgi:hypothetical protein